MTELAHSLGSLVIIDGAHAPGALGIDVKAIGADYYLGNCHKWLYCPKGTGFMWVAPALQSEAIMQPTVISASGVHTFTGRFAYTGTRDYTPFACIPAALEFLEKELGGMEAMQRYCSSLCASAAQMLVEKWQTSLLVCWLHYCCCCK